MDHLAEKLLRGTLGDKTLLWENIIFAYDLSKERIQEQNYKIELALRKLKRSM